MAVETEADRLALLSDFGIDVVATVGGQPQPSVKAIFDDAYYEPTLDGGRIASAKPTLLVRSSDCANWKKSTTTVSVNATTWRVGTVEPDGTGFSQVRLLVGP